jgi:glutathione peroxidase
MKKFYKTMFFVVLTLFFTKSSFADLRHDQGKAGKQNAYDFEFVSIDGESFSLNQYDGKVLLIVNTASYCGFTKQYNALQKLWDRYRQNGLVVIGVPSNDFANQEPGTNDEIKKFCEVNFGINFPMTEKVSVIGEAAHPFYKWASNKVGFIGSPKWNFHKFLIGKQGQLLEWYSSTTGPLSKNIAAAIQLALSNE